MPKTIVDIAQHTGLSLGTISKYLNGGNVREPNKKAIEKAIIELDYHVNEVAQSLKSKRTKTIGLMLPDLTSLFCVKLFTAVNTVLAQHGYSTIITDARSSNQRELENAHFLARKKVDGIIAIPYTNNPEAFKFVCDRNLPLVLIDKPVDNIKCCLVNIDNHLSFYSAVSRLIAMGHQKIGLACMQSIITGEERLQGYKDALKDHCIEFNPDLVAMGELSIEGGRLCCLEILEKAPDITAIVSTHDGMTFGILKALSQKKIRYPEDISVVGCDIYEFAESFYPSLSDIMQPLENMGNTAASLLIEQLFSPTLKEPRTITFSSSFYTRDSVRSLR